MRNSYREKVLLSIGDAFFVCYYVMFFNYNIVCVVVVSLCLDLYLCLFSYVLILITFVIKKKV